MSGATNIAFADLANWPLPEPAQATDKDQRGRVLVVAGGALVPGAPILTGMASLRAGAGKLQLAAGARFVATLGMAAPEAAILEVAASVNGELTAEAAGDLAEFARCADAVVIGPGMGDPAAAGGLAAELMAQAPDTAFVLDAAALTGLETDQATRPLGGGLVFTPHAGEMAHLLGETRSTIENDPLDAARRAARRLQGVAVMKGAVTYIVSPDGRAWRHADGVVGLATSGSGDVLAGVIGGLLARGASPVTAAIWGVCLHGWAGARLTERVGPLGFLARDLLGQLPVGLDAPGGATRAARHV
jgi:ADP-dependent NAD(P)H-hydrate dehydratase